MPCSTGPLQRIDLPLTRARRVELWILREDLRHHPAAGNKWHKLRHNLEAARAAGQHRLLSFGGAYSNHILALAAIAAEQGFETIGVIRGEAAHATNPVLSRARALGMRLHFVTRETYRRRHDPAWQQALSQDFGHPYLIPEGGSNALGVRGCRELGEALLQATRGDFDTLCCAVGSGGTLAGLSSAIEPGHKTLGYTVVHDTSLPRRIAALLPSQRRQPELRAAARRGYGRSDARLDAFITDFIARTGIPIEPVYTGKLLLGICEDIEQGRFTPGSRLIVLHSGGVQSASRKVVNASTASRGVR